MHFDPACDLILGVGSGVVNDLCKVFAHATGRRSAIVGTAPSMDGFASNSASMEVNNVKSTSTMLRPPLSCWTRRFLRRPRSACSGAGLGDMAAKYCSVCEWRIANIVIGEYYCEEVADMMRASLAKIMAAAPRLMRRDPDAVQPIAEGLVTAGLAMAYAQVSRPASGLEHYFSHVWEMQALERGVPYDLHGIQVGVGTMLTFQVLSWLRQVRPDRARAEKHMRDFDEAAWAETIRRIFGKTAGEILRAEQKFRKKRSRRPCEAAGDDPFALGRDHARHRRGTAAPGNAARRSRAYRHAAFAGGDRHFPAGRSRRLCRFARYTR